MNSQFRKTHVMDDSMSVSLPGVGVVIHEIAVKKEMEEERTFDVKKLSPQTPPPGLPDLDLKKVAKLKGAINKKPSKSFGSRGGGLKPSEKGQERKNAMLAKTPFHKDEQGRKVYHFNLADYNYKNMAVMGDVDGVKLENDPGLFQPPCDPRNVTHYVFEEEERSKNMVHIPNKITIARGAYEVMIWRFMENTDRITPTRSIIMDGPQIGGAKYTEAWVKAKKNVSKKWLMLGLHRARHLDKGDDEVWVMTADGWNNNAGSCQVGSRDGLSKVKSSEGEVYTAVGQIVIDD
jgi:hypothetical protein